VSFRTVSNSFVFRYSRSCGPCSGRLTFSSPTTQEDAASTKAIDLHNYNRFSTPAPWPIEQGPSTHSSQVYTHCLDYSSSDEQPTFAYPFPPSMSGDLDAIYPSHSFDPLWQLHLQSTTLSSPRSTGPGPTGWEMDPTSFPASVTSSPASTCAVIPPITIPQGQNGVPYPLPWLSQRDPYGDLNLEGLLEDQHLGVSLSLRTKQHYADAYWKNFHHQFPILHKQSYQSQSPSPLLGAAVMAVGAQYADEPFAKSDSRILHEKCLELITKVEEY
jgi:hypothetical protein